MRNRHPIAVTVFVVSILAVGYGLHGTLASGGFDLLPTAKADPGNKHCSAHTLQGAYGIKFDGQKIQSPQNLLFSSVSRILFDGQGTFTTHEIGRFNGDPIDRTFTGPYTVNSDCTGDLDFSSNLTNPPHQAHGSIVIVDNGKSFYVVDNEDGWAAGGVATRQ